MSINELSANEMMEAYRLASEMRKRRAELVAACNKKWQIKVANYLENRTPERMRELEEMPYSEFLRTTEWKQMSWLVLQLRKICAHCGEPAKEVHHQTYKFGRLYPEALEAVCHNCHEVIHGASFVNETPP